VILRRMMSSEPGAPRSTAFSLDTLFEIHACSVSVYRSLRAR
jgi:hypothetical protein